MIRPQYPLWVFPAARKGGRGQSSAFREMAFSSIAKATGRRALYEVNRPLRRLGLELVRAGSRDYTEFREYIPYTATLVAARKAGLSVGDYIDAVHNRPGATAETVERLVAMGLLVPGLRRICEIGPGSGRYLERTIAACRPQHYEIYETAAEWRDYLVDEYGVEARPTNDVSLAPTPDASVDLVQAHKVFPGLSFLVCLSYFAEMVRVVAPGGGIVFDVVTEECMDEATVASWRAARSGYQLYPSLIPRAFTIAFFAAHGVELKGSFIVPMAPGKTECLVFKKPLS